MEEIRARRGATADLSNAFRQVSTERYAPGTADLQARKLVTRFGLSPSVAAVTAALAYGSAETWRAAR